MFDRLLVAIDHSESSTRVIAMARDLAKTAGSKVFVLHLREHEVLGRLGVPATEETDEGRAEVDDAVGVLRAAGVTAEGAVLDTIFGHAAREIVDQAAAHDVSVIVMGSRGRSELASLVVGSTAHKVLHLSDRPVLVVR